MTPMSSIRRALLVTAWLAALTAPALAHDYTVGDLHIDHPWARATVAGQRAGGAFLTIDNRGRSDDRLLRVQAPADRASSAELHSMRQEGDVMRMREVGSIDIPAGQTVKLQPGGLHIMLMGLKAPLQAGDKFPLVLTFEKAGSVTVEVLVQAVNAAADKRDTHGGGHHKH